MHAAALVIVPKEGADNLREWVAKLMEPYDENTSRDGWWDWWRVGGRWDGYYLGLDKLDGGSTPEADRIHYSDAVETLERNSAPANRAGKWGTHAVVSPEGYREKEMRNPTWKKGDGWDTYMIDTPDFQQWHAEQLVKYRDGIVVVVDYHF